MRWLLSSTVGYVIGLLFPANATFKAIKQAEAHRLADPAWSQETASNVSSSSAASSSSSTAQQNALRRRRADVDSLMMQWLMYWIVMAVYTVCEVLFETLLFGASWFPFYHECKVGFILWLTLPQFRGATILYKRFLAPTLETYESDIDGHLDVARKRVSKELSKGVGAAGEFVRKRGSSIFAAGSRLVSQSVGSEAEGGGSAAGQAGQPAAEDHKDL
jgi:hypothetical protein